MKYWLIYNDDGEMSGYSNYKQFEGQRCVDKLPDEFLAGKSKGKEIEEAVNIIENSNPMILEYIECTISGNISEITEGEFKDLCGKRKKARDKIKVLKGEKK